MKIRALTYSRYHGKSNVGSTRLRVLQLMQHWPEYQEYTYGEKPDVMVFQKVYMQPDWKFIDHIDCIKILDICDPDWMDQQNVKETADAVDGITVPTEALADFMRQLTDKPVKIIPDRHDLVNIPALKRHANGIKHAAWFGYSHNAELLKQVIPTLEKRGISLTVISNDNPFVDRWGTDLEYHFKKFNEETLLTDLRQFDICIFPAGNRPRDRFKSNNRTTLGWLAGVPVVPDIETLDIMEDPRARNKEAQACYDKAIKEYDVKLSVADMKSFIEELKDTK